MSTDLQAGAGFIEGKIVPIGEARIPILDRGFLRSDVTYDVVAVWKGAFFRLDDHLDRFERSCREMRLKPPHGREEIIQILNDLVSVTGLRDAYVNVTCTRGVGGTRDPRTFETHRFYAYAIPYLWILEQPDEDAGMNATVVETIRRIPPSSVDPTVKNFHWGDFTRAQFEAFERGATYPILLDADGIVTEGVGFNVFAVLGGSLVTPAAGALIGVTRKTILELAERHGIPVEQRAIDAEEFRSADELFATSTAGGVMPITTIDGRELNGGRSGPLTRRLRDLYWQAHEEPEYTRPVVYRGRANAPA